MAVNILIGFFGGIISGMGVGGGVVLIPALVFFQGVGQQLAQGINLTCFLPTAVVALAIHIRSRRVRVKDALMLGVCGVFGALIGAWIATHMEGELLRRLFGGFLIFVGIYEIRKGFCTKTDK